MPRSGIPHPHARGHLHRVGGTVHRGDELPQAFWAPGLRHLPGCGGRDSLHVPLRGLLGDYQPGRWNRVRRLLVPAAVGLIVLRGPVITLLFEHGAFEASDTSRTAWALLFYALGLFSYAGRDTLTRVFYAYQDTRTPVKISVVAVVLNIAVSLVLMRFLGVGGLALGTTIAMTVNMIVLMELLRRRLGPMGFGRLLRSFLRILAAAGIMGLAVWGVDGLLVGWVEVGNLGLGARVAAGMAAGVVVYVGSAALGGIRELDEAKEMLREVFPRSSPEV